MCSPLVTAQVRHRAYAKAPGLQVFWRKSTNMLLLCNRSCLSTRCTCTQRSPGRSMAFTNITRAELRAVVTDIIAVCFLQL